MASEARRDASFFGFYYKPKAVAVLVRAEARQKQAVFIDSRMSITSETCYQELWLSSKTQSMCFMA